MTKLTDTQRAILIAAASRDGGAVEPLPAHIKGGAATKVIHALLAGGLITEIPFSITPAGRSAITPAPEDGKTTVPAALEKLTVGQIATAISVLTGESVAAKSFNYKGKALDRLATLMRDRNVSVREVLVAAGIEAVTPDGTALSGLGLNAEEPAPEPAKAAAPAHKARPDSKQAQLIEMLKRHHGSSIEEIVAKFGWQAHTVRGAIAGALKKKLGLTVISEKVEGRGRVYRIAE